MARTVMKRIGILTGGGDVPGLNSVIKSVVYRSSEVGWQTMGIRRGWQGLTHVDPGREDGGGYLRPLDRVSTRVIDRTGGTVLHTSRTSPSSMGRSALPEHLDPARIASLEVEGGRYDLTPLVLENLERLALDALVVIGGDDTLSYAARLWREGYPVVAIPKTMDNDVHGTEYCIGFSTAVTRAKELINRQRTTLGSHERIGVFRIFGRNAGYTAWYAAYVTSARCVIPEVRFDLDALSELLADDRRLNPSAYSFVIASEGAIWKGGELREVGDPDAYGHRHKADVGEALADELHRRTGVETVHSDLTYDLRSGDPDALDQMVSITFANVAVDLLAEGQFGRMVAVRDGKYAHAPLPERSAGARTLDVEAMYNTARFRPRYEAKLGSPLLLGPAVIG
ncbi:MAG: ATP-dependent phosphofructokinase / diphosphate-dependent phosphofructokinase [Chloroflexota bacterium]|jgi:6-phosphofructokinase 1|nr:ATP-dependent phosphofructokinase / diphosphate-dependent phosphofructokinase [Chloroflexota bacterium]